MNLKQMLVLVYALAGSSALGFAANPASNKVTANSNRTAAALPSCDPWLASKVYTAGNYALSNKSVWRAKWWTQNEIPGTSAVWEARAASECIAGSGGGDTGGTIPKGIPTLKQVQADELSKTSSPLFQNIKASIRTLDSAAVELVQAGRAANPMNVKRIEKILNVNDWQTLFPMRDASYSYVRFLQAMAKFPAVCDDYTDGRNADAICRKTLATMFAHFAQETGAHDPNSAIPQWRQALYFLREAGCSDTGAGCGYNAECDPATWQGQVWQCGKQADGSYKKYFGRGAKQLSYNYNYGPFSDAMFGTVRTLLDKPELVADTWLNLASAVFFYVYPQPPKPSMLHVVDGTWKPNAADQAANITAGFGASISIINGGIECGQGTDKQQALNRISYYQSMAGFFAVPIDRGEALSCAKMAPFPAGGAGAQLISWEQDWSYDPSRADGKTYACKLVGYQTPYSALKSGDYVRCVEHFFNVVLK
ncbi:glycoside hydrolase family 19 protein [Undibacterium sp. Ren11W]|uniref:glycoside hydrolase family 19 protein n=1 Tax=Undibacterium sp. Ren11W TaxID=3413045 RepID=UPI003BF3E29F